MYSFPQRVFHLNTLGQYFKYNNINLYKCSMNLNKRLQMTTYPVLSSYYIAFLEYYPVTISHDILWMPILQGFNHHLRLNSQKLKSKFVKSNADDKIVVTKHPKVDKNIIKISRKRWGYIFKDFVE